MPVFALQIEADAHVDAAVPEMPVEGAVVVVFVHQLADVAQVAAEFFRRYGGIVPAFPLGRRAGRKRGGARAGFADLPDGACFCCGVDARSWADRACASGARRAARPALCACSGSSAPNSTSRKPPPFGKQLDVGRVLFCLRPSTMLPSKPSRPMGLNSRISGT